MLRKVELFKRLPLAFKKPLKLAFDNMLKWTVLMFQLYNYEILAFDNTLY
jgi:hypothetical protein